MVDYSKWKKIEVSDDEDETHPNIDTPSLFRWRHKARVERMEEYKKEKEELKNKKDGIKKRLEDAKKQLKSKPNDEDVKKRIKELEQESENIKKEEEEFKKKEKSMPWNVDTISHEGFTKTVFNKKDPLPDEESLTEEEKEKRMNEFINKNEPLLKDFGMLRKYEDSRDFLQKHGDLVCEDTPNYLVLWCIQLEMEGKHDLMKHVAHQVICMQYILELSKQLKIHPRACVAAFFSRIKDADVEYKAVFEDELSQFKKRIQQRAAQKIAEIEREIKEEERANRLGPGGLDPQEVIETLPPELKKCFDSQNVDMLHEVIAKMDPNDAKYHMKRCVDSGLWVPHENDIEDSEKDIKSEKNTKEPEKDIKSEKDIKKSEKDINESEAEAKKQID